MHCSLALAMAGAWSPLALNLNLSRIDAKRAITQR
jgi:hypothetical protein